MDRREFLLGAGAVAAASTWPEASFSFNASELQSSVGLSILQGLTTETTTQLSVDVPIAMECVYELIDSTSKQSLSPTQFRSATFPGSDTRVDKIHFSGLKLGRVYVFRVIERKTNKTIDERFLQAVDLKNRNARFAIMSCMNAGKSVRNDIWQSAQISELDYLFFIGDTVYGDELFSHSSKLLWSKFVDGRKAIPFYHWKHLKPVIGVWDDHDYGKNDAGGSYKNKNKNLEIFKAFFAQDPDNRSLFSGPGCSSFFKAFGQNFVFLDNRFFRALKYQDGSLSFLGVDQINFVTDLVYKNPAPTFCFEGSPWFGRTEKSLGTSYESVSRQEQEAFFKVMRSWNVPVLLGGGDLHFSEISKVDKKHLGFETYEIVSSCMHSGTKSRFYDNPNAHLNGYLKENFIVLETARDSRDLMWSASCRTVGQREVFNTSIVIA